LQVCPLGVKHQFVEEDGPMVGIEWQYVTSTKEILEATSPYLITNYERVRDGHKAEAKGGYEAGFDCSLFTGVNLDEGSVLRSLGSDTYEQFNLLFCNTAHKFVCTATPSPNRIKELIHYAEFLGIADRGLALTKYFKRDSQKAGNLKLHESQEEAFWLWVSTWALFVQYPSDLGHSDEGYVLPELKVNYVRLAADHRRAWDRIENNGQRQLLANSATSLSAAAAEKRDSIGERVAATRQIIDENGPDDNWVIWHHLEDERRAIEKEFPEAVSVFGSQQNQIKEERILGFSRGEFQILSTKPQIAGSGCNFQYHCHKMIFLGVNHKFQDFIQAVYRIQRFRQGEPCEIWIVHMDSEDSIVETRKFKWNQHDEIVSRMREIVKKYGLIDDKIRGDLKRKMDIETKHIKKERYQIWNNDTVIQSAKLEENSLDMIMTSIPFGDHYEYSDNYQDMGHNAGNVAFFEQMDHLVPSLLKALKPGRVACIHVKDRIRYGSMTGTGFPTIDPFSDDTSACFRKHGFHLMTRISIMTDVVRENNQTYRLGYSEMVKDGTKMGGPNDQQPN